MTVDTNPPLNQTVIFEDFYADAKCDIVWHNPETGECALWRVNDLNTTEAFLPQFDFDWKFVTGDFNGDGRSDFFWRNQQTGESQLWLMDGTNVVAVKNLFSLNSDWDLSIGSFNEDLNHDIFWHNRRTGENVVWLMNGTNATGFPVTSATESTLEMFAADWNYKLGDFNGDRNSDIFWHNQQTGENVVWLMHGTVVTEQAFVENFLLAPTSDWDFLIGDFNGDHNSDIFWRNKRTGENIVWLMNGTKIIATSVLPSLDSNWDLSIASFKSNSKNDIFWRNRLTGENVVWLMDGTNATGVSLPTLPTAWIPYVGSFKGDGSKTTDIFWHNTETGQNTIWLTNGKSLTGSSLATQLSTVLSVA
jgi:hypothetical protein